MKAGRRRNERKEQAITRQENRTKLANAEQLAVLDKRLGVGVGAVKERMRLSGEKQEKVAVEVPTILEEVEETKEKEFKVKKHQDPIKEKKKFKRQQREEKK